MLPVTAAILVDALGRVLLARRPERGANASKWEFPGGKLREGESPEDCLRRELQEELGIEVEVGEVFHVVNHPYAWGSVLLLAYLCRWRGGEIRLTEHSACQWAQMDRLVQFDLSEADRAIAEKLSRRAVSLRASVTGKEMEAEGRGSAVPTGLAAVT
jgi:8-oxo-dGTP diphosphatase